MLKACAHRRRKRGTAYEWGLGLCISMTNVLDEDGFWEPCDGKPKSRGHGEYGYCQAGTSAVVDSVCSLFHAVKQPLYSSNPYSKNNLNSNDIAVIIAIIIISRTV